MFVDRSHAWLHINQPNALAVRIGNRPMCHMLLRSGANPSAVDSVGFAPLHKAVAYGHPGCLGLMLARQGVDPNLKVKKGSW